MTACTAPPQLQLTVLPDDATLYRIADELGFDSWHFGLLVRSRASTPPRFDELRLTHLASGQPVEHHRYHRPALLAHLAEPLEAVEPPEATEAPVAFLRDFHLLSPRAAGVDAMRLQLFADGASVADRFVTIDRYQQWGRYRLPVNGCWLVSSGHDFGVEHRRWYNRSHFAWDLVKVDAGGSPHGAADGLASYFSFGETVVAPGDGRVVLTKDDSPDNPAGVIGAKGTTNFLLINHGHGEFSKIGHLQQGSLLVADGARVRAGQPLARIGNNGRSDAPHLHFHFQRTRFDSQGVVTAEEPLPIQLSGYAVTSNKGVGLPVERGRPRRGEFVCAAAAP